MRMDTQQGGLAGGINASGQQVLKQLLEDGPGDHIFLLRLFKVTISISMPFVCLCLPSSCS